MQRPRAAPGTNTSRAVETAVGTGTLGRPITSRQSPRLSRHGNSPKRRHKRHGDRQLTQQSGRRSPKGVPNGLSPLSPVVYAGWRPTGVKPSAAVGVWPQVRYLSPRSRLGTGTCARTQPSRVPPTITSCRVPVPIGSRDRWRAALRAALRGSPRAAKPLLWYAVFDSGPAHVHSYPHSDPSAHPSERVRSAIGFRAVQTSRLDAEPRRRSAESPQRCVARESPRSTAGAPRRRAQSVPSVAAAAAALAPGERESSRADIRFIPRAPSDSSGLVRD